MCGGGGTVEAQPLPEDHSIELMQMQIAQQEAAAQRAAQQAAEQRAYEAQQLQERREYEARQAAIARQQEMEDRIAQWKREENASFQRHEAQQQQAAAQQEEKLRLEQIAAQQQQSIFDQQQAVVQQAAAAEAAKEAQRLKAFDTNMNMSYSAAIRGAQDYFTSMGLDPAEFDTQITNGANDIKSGLHVDFTPNPSTHFANYGENIYSQLENANRSSASRALDEFASTGFAKQMIGSSSANDTIQAVLAEQEQERRNYADNLLARGVVTDSGYQAALGSIDDQRFGVEAGLSEIANAVLESGRSDLRDVAADGRTAVNNLKLGQSFDAETYRGEIDDKFTQFMQGLGGNVRSRVGENMFDMSSLLSKAGSGQSAQNTAFDPAAFFGANVGEEIDDDEDDANNPFAVQPVF